MESYIDLILANIESFEGNLSVFNSKFTNSELAVNQQEEDSQQEKGEPLTEIQIELFLQDVDNSAVEIVKLLSYSLLSGEYIYAEDIKKSLNIIEGKVKDFIKNTDYLPTDIQSKIFEYSSCITIIIEGYKIFIQDISNQYSTDRIEFLFSQNNQFENVIKESDLSGKLASITDYFFYLISITHIDHFPSNENEYITDLFDLEKKINNLKIHEYTDITRNILIKIKFLMHKWKERKVSENPKSHLYLLDGDIKTVENFKEENLKLKEWCEIIETQYELISKSWIHILESRVKPYKHKNLSDLKVLEIHQLIKYYKDVKPDYTKLNDIYIYLRDKTDLNANNYDVYANIVATNYSLNNSFSLFLELNRDLTIIKEKYTKVKDGIKGEINNFFLEKKYLEYITEFLLKKINEDDKIQYIDRYEDIIKSHCKTEVDSYFSKKEWAKLNFNYIFILPFEECLVPCNDVKGLDNIFYASSFVLPPTSNKIEKEYEKIKEDFEKINLLISTGKYFKTEIQKIEKLNSELDRKDFKSIEIISIFTAIITFILSSIPAYKFINSAEESILFMLSLATALAIFITLIFFSTRDLYLKWQSYIPVFLITIIFAGGYYSLINSEKQELIIDKKTSQKIDSISQKRIDSILNIKGYNSKIKPNSTK
jgi:hypothetical protein